MQLRDIKETKQDEIKVKASFIARIATLRGGSKSERADFERHSTSFRAFQEVSPFDGVGKRHGYDV